MSVQLLLQYLPNNTEPFLKKWFGEHFIHLKITKGRSSKLGDYRRLPDNSHQITINSELDEELFFFVLTHELAHLIAFETYGRRILSHGKEWKLTFRMMLLESISIYSANLQPIILKFSKAPKANFMASPDLVKYFKYDTFEEGSCYLEDLQPGEHFIFRNLKFRMNGKVKKNYLCTDTRNGRQYKIHPLAKVTKSN